MVLIAFDLSFSNTGVAVSNDGHVEAYSKSFTLPRKKKGEAEPNGDLRFGLFNDWIEETFALQQPDAVAFEETHMNGKAGAYIHHFMYCKIRSLCALRGIPYYTLSPLSLKKYATGSGKADKSAMQAEAGRRFKWYDASTDAGSDCADSLLLLCWLKENHEHK